MFSRPALDAVRQLIRESDVGRLQEMVDQLLEEAIDASVGPSFDAATEASYEAIVPPREVFDVVVGDLTQLREALSQFDWRWRLDITMALEDFVGEEERSLAP